MFLVPAIVLTACSCASARQLLHRSLANAPTSTPAPDIGGDLIPYEDWGLEFVTTPAADAALRQEQLNKLMDSDLSEWEVIIEREYVFARRPVATPSGIQPVGIFKAEYSTAGGAAFFEYLTTTEGFLLLDPDTTDHAETRAISQTVEGPEGATVYPVAQITDGGEDLGDLFAITASHWHFCGPNALNFYSYPVSVPVDTWLPEYQPLAGTLPEYTLMFSVRIRQLDPSTIEFINIFWFSLAPPEPAGTGLLGAYFAALNARILEHLAAVDYPPGTSSECGDNGGVYGDR